MYIYTIHRHLHIQKRICKHVKIYYPRKNLFLSYHFNFRSRYQAKICNHKFNKQQIYKYILLPNEFRYYFCSTNFTNATLFKRSTLNFFESMACFFFLSSSSINEMYSQFFQFLFVNKSKMNTRENIQNESIQINEKKRKKLKKKFFKKKVM